MLDRRFIEFSFPVKEISEISVRERNIRHGHISTLHIWWARRPLASSRASVYLSLVPEAEDVQEWQSKTNFVVELSKWENSLASIYIQKAREDILKANGGKPPSVLDPFAGGGSIPLEALRLGCEVHALDYNPVATLILKAVLEFPYRFSKPFEGMPDLKKLHTDEKSGSLFEVKRDFNPLLFAVQYWGKWVLERAKQELEEFYSSEEGEIPVGYIWARTIPCQNPACGVEIPLMRQFWLARREKKIIALRPVSEGPGKPINFRIISNLPEYEPWEEGFDPEEGTVSRAHVVCPACGSRIDDNTTRRLFREGKAGERLVAVVYTRKGRDGKFYRLPTQKDLETFEKAKAYLEKKVRELREKWDIEPVPDEPTPEGKGRGAERAFSLRNYALDTYGDLFNPRQKLALLVFADAIRESYSEMLRLGYPQDFAKAVVGYLSFMISRLADWNAKLSVWRPDQERNEHVFNRQALPMVWDYAERNPIIGELVGTGAIEDIISHLSTIHRIHPDLPQPVVKNGSATSLPYPDNYFDAVITDPPYYDNVSYSYLSDFFYVWLKRVLGDIYPELFSTPLTPKSAEIVAYSHIPGGYEEGKRLFEEKLSQAFREIYRVLKPGGIAVIVYAHKSTEGWETVINALLNSGLVVDASWPIHTEMQSRLNAQGTASLASSIYIVARKRDRQEVGFYEEVRKELKDYINQKLEDLWSRGISGADFFIAGIGAGMEVFGKYKKIVRLSGEPVGVDTLLEDIRKILADYAVRKIMKNGYAEGLSGLTRFYVLWRWQFKNSAQKFDEARKLAAGVGIDLATIRHSLIKKEKDTVYLKDPTERKIEELENSKELIDVLHYAVLLWKSGQNDKLVKVLAEYGNAELVYITAQAIAQSLNNCREKQLLEGFLSSRERIKRESIKEKQRDLFAGG